MVSGRIIKKYEYITLSAFVYYPKGSLIWKSFYSALFYILFYSILLFETRHTVMDMVSCIPFRHQAPSHCRSSLIFSSRCLCKLHFISEDLLTRENKMLVVYLKRFYQTILGLDIWVVHDDTVMALVGIRICKYLY